MKKIIIHGLSVVAQPPYSVGKREYPIIKIIIVKIIFDVHRGIRQMFHLIPPVEDYVYNIMQMVILRVKTKTINIYI